MSHNKLSIVQGQITFGPQQNALITRTIDFVYTQLPGWRDRTGRVNETDEERLNAQLTRHLNGCALKTGFPAIFQHEDKQTGRRRIDIAASPSDFAGAIIGSTYFAFDDAFLVLEGKRLPPPGGKSRKREYVSGEPEITGGIQRFKLGLHGAKLSVGVLVGYVQDGAIKSWHSKINRWLRALARRSKQNNGDPKQVWIASEVLETLTLSPERCSRCSSHHPRIDSVSESIRLYHLWTQMSG